MAILSAPAHFIVLDACVLMSGVLRPALLTLAAQQLYIPLWSERIGLEWRRNAARLWDVPMPLLQNEWDLMQARFPQSNIADSEAYEAGLRYSDKKDWHVIATGLAARARSPLPIRPQVTVLTWNLKDFNRSELRRQGLEVCDPDRLLGLWWREHSSTILKVLLGTLQTLADDGRGRAGTLAQILRRERLFRLAKLVGEPQAA